MELKKITDEINRLNVSQKIILTQAIWDSIANDQENFPMPEWQKKELDKRYAKHRENGLQLHDWQEVHQALRSICK